MLLLLKLTQCNYLDMHREEYKEKYLIDKTNFYEIRESIINKLEQIYKTKRALKDLT